MVEAGPEFEAVNPIIEPIAQIATPGEIVLSPYCDPENPTQAHHWIIESPHGSTSAGRCKCCNEMREFRNSAVDTLWDGDPFKAGLGNLGNRLPEIRINDSFD